MIMANAFGSAQGRTIACVPLPSEPQKHVSLQL